MYAKSRAYKNLKSTKMNTKNTTPNFKLLAVGIVAISFFVTSCTSLRPVPVGSGSFLGGGSVDYALRKDPAQFVPDLISTLTLTYSRNPKPKPQIPNPRPQTLTLTLSLALIITDGIS